MIEFRRLSGKWRIRASTEKLFEPVPKNGRIRVSIRKWENPGDYFEKVEFVRVPRNFPGEYQKMVESGSVPENDRIRATIGKMENPCEYRETFRTCTQKWKIPGQYRKMRESGLLFWKGRIRASTEKLSGWAPKNGRNRVSKGEW